MVVRIVDDTLVMKPVIEVFVIPIDRLSLTYCQTLARISSHAYGNGVGNVLDSSDVARTSKAPLQNSPVDPFALLAVISR